MVCTSRFTERIRKLFKTRNKEMAWEVIGIIGTGKGVGVTHFAIMTAGYISGILRKKCAVLEWNNHGDFPSMKKVCTKKEGQGRFRILETDYYEKAGIDTLLLCKKLGYQTVIVDYGTIHGGNLEEFFRCDRQFVLGSLSEWQIKAFLEFEEKERRADKSWETLVTFGSEESRKNIQMRLNLPIRRVPVSVDAFVITSESLRFYQEILH